MLPDLSVVIPTYKRGDSLKNLLQCLKNQKSLKIEIIVVDQNGDDFFNQEMKQLLTTVIHIKLDKPNASRARNVGFLKAHSSVILFMDDDLLPEPEFCLKGLEVFKKFPEIECFVPLVYNDLGLSQAFQDIELKKKIHHPQSEDIISIGDTITAAVFFLSSSFKKTGGFDEFLFDFAGTAEDQEFFLRIFKQGYSLWCASNIHVFHDENVTGGCELRTSNYWKTREKCIKSWVFRYRIHNLDNSKLSLNSLFFLSRSAFLNREVLRSGIQSIVKQIKMLLKARAESKIYLKGKSTFYNQKNYSFLN